MDNCIRQIERLETSMFGPSVYAHVDTSTLAVLDTCCDQQTMPRSWLVCQILQQWAEARLRQKQGAAA